MRMPSGFSVCWGCMRPPCPSAAPPRPQIRSPTQQPTHPPRPARLRDDDRKSPDVVAYLKAENEYTEAVLADTKDLQVWGGVRVWRGDAAVQVAFQGL